MQLVQLEENGNLIGDRDQTITGLGRLAAEVIVADRTLDATDHGLIVIAGAVDLDVILPPTQAGLWYRIIIDTISTTGLTLSPDANDQLIGHGFTAADAKHAINTGATDVIGDWIEVLGNGTTGWHIVGVNGIWIRET